MADPKIYSRSATEAQIQQSIEDWLTRKKIPFTVSDASLYFNKQGKPRRRVKTDGWPDLTACLKGRFWGIECKRYGGSLRDSQRACLDRLQAEGAIITLAYSLDDVIKTYNFFLAEEALGIPEKL